MGRFKPLIASLATIAIAMAVLFAWSLLRTDAPPRKNSANAPVNAPPTGLVMEQVDLDPRPQWDPPELWPQDGQRMSSPEFWVLWKTDDFCDCRLLSTRDEHLWYEVGHTAGDTHYLKIDLSIYDSRVTFAVDFLREGKKYRSKPRTVTYGRGAHFSEREYRFQVAPKPEQFFSMFLRGRDPVKVPGNLYRHGWFLGDMVVGYQPMAGDDKGGEVKFYVQDGKSVPAGGCVGWVEIYDEIGDSRDRTLVHLRP